MAKHTTTEYLVITVDENELSHKLADILDGIENRDVAVASLAVSKLATYLQEHSISQKEPE